ncbi:hypothetical protein CRM22_003813 [Opisthorchis felineus]|uniref:sn-1-specific diacylglycerol lipase n=1 Tax=Opisthorchis felineus TaxID=147828 RepID=A0A4V3SFQ6_OPIFE|nr:hypothetical protein CRM22_003813 [Opisthorchis felineus]
MPAIIFLRRSWSFASDEFVFSAAFDILSRAICMLIMGLPFVILSAYSTCLSTVVAAVFFGILFGSQIVMIILDIILSALSGRGGPMEVSRRKHVPHVLSAIFLLSFVELAVHCVSIYTATIYGQSCPPPVPIAFIVGNALRIAHVLLCYIWLIAHFRESGTFWSQMVYENQPMQKGFIPHNANVATKQQAHEMLSRSIHRRLRRLGALGRPRCGNEDRQENEEQLAISSAAALFSEFFYDVNLVPSDIVAGLLLLRWQTTQWVGSGHRVPLSVIEQDTKPCTFPPVAADPGTKQLAVTSQFGDVVSQYSRTTPTWLSIVRLQRISQIGISIYGHLFYCLASKGTPAALYRLCRHLSCASCEHKSGPDGPTKVGCCLCAGHNCDLAAVVEMSGLPLDNFVTISFENTVYLSPYFVAVDDVSRCIVIAVRGTLSFEDAIVDLLCDGVRLEEIENVVEEQVGKRPTFVGHRGMVGSARRLFHCLLQEKSIEIAKAKRPDYSLVVCGHSLGAGIASFLTLLLRPMYPDIKGYALSAPLGMMNSELADYAKPFLISIIYGFDAFARMNRATILDFKWRLIDALSACDVPKHRILSRGFELCVSRCCHKGCRACCCCPIRRPVTVGDDTRLLSTTLRNRLIHPNPDLPLSPEESIILPSGTGDTTEESIDRPQWPNRLRMGNRSLLCWMDPEIARLFCTTTSVSDYEQTMLDSNSDHPVQSNSQPQLSSNQMPQPYDLRDGVCGGLVLHVVDVAIENCPTHSVDSGSDHFVHSPIYGTERQMLSPRMVNEDECCCSSKLKCEATVAVWTNCAQFLTFLIHPRMFVDHMPNNFAKAVNRLYATAVGDPVLGHPNLKPADVFREFR